MTQRAITQTGLSVGAEHDGSADGVRLPRRGGGRERLHDRVNRRFWALLAGSLWVLALSLHARAATDVGPPDAPVRYKVLIDAPRELADALQRGLDLVRWQDYDDMTGPVLERLMAEGAEQAKSIAAAQGYFSAQVQISVETTGLPGSPRTLRLAVKPGERVRISAIDIQVTGPAAVDDRYGRPAIATIRRDWSLPPGSPFSQQGWDAAKAKALATLARSPYAAAALARSEALVDPERLSASLAVEIASGPSFRFGELLVEGLDRYPVSIVRNYSTLVKGEPYTAERLDEYTRRLLASGYFASVQSSLVAEPAHADAAAVRVAVIEAPRRRIEGGVGYATDSGATADIRYTDVDFARRGLQLELNARVDQKIQNAGAVLRLPPGDDGYLDSVSVRGERTYISGLETLTAVGGVRRETLEERSRTGYGVSYYEDNQSPLGAPATSSRALYVEVDRSWRNTDSLVRPTRGHVVNVQVGGSPTGLATQAFGRMISQVAFWHPMGARNELFARAEAGAILAQTREGIPSALLFRTGGDTTVRGYAFESLGVRAGDATVGGRYYLATSIEATHFFDETVGMAAFVDAGNAADSPAALHPVLGYGVGVRVQSPVGRFRGDIAYGEATRGFRVHLSVGVVF